MDEMLNNQTPNSDNLSDSSTGSAQAHPEHTCEPTENAATQSFDGIEATPQAAEKPNEQYTYQGPAAQQSFSSTRPQYQDYQPRGSYTYQSSPYSYEQAQPFETKQQSTTPPFAVTKKEKRSSFSLLTLIACVIVAVILSGVVSSGICYMFMSGKLGNGQTGSSSNGLISNQFTTITNNTDNYVEAVAEKVQPSVVGIVIQYKYTTQSFFGGSSTKEEANEGSGVIYTTDGYIITNKHVIENAINYNGEVYVYLPNNLEKAYKATIIGYDASVDLAIIKIDENNLPAAEIGTSSDLKVGQNAVAIGNPGGMGFLGSVSVGYISGLNRKVTIDSTTMSLIQTDSAINPGNSGGALVDNEGKLIGITNAKLVDEEFEGMGFAIPVDTVVEICDGIIAGKDKPKPYIGVQISTSYTAEVLEAYGMPAGAVIASVVEGGPAEKAGLRQYDIIVAVGDIEVKGYDTLVAALSKYNVGDTVRVRVYREGRYQNLEVTLTANG